MKKNESMISHFLTGLTFLIIIYMLTLNLMFFFMINDDYIERRHAERVLEEELNTRGKPVWYLPHYPVKHPLKAKVRLVHDCAVKFGQTSLVVGDIEAMFHQFMVDPKDCDTF